MMVLITYDVETLNLNGRNRLRKVSKVCVNFGQRVQNSVFECSLDPGQYIMIKKKLEKIIDSEKDSIRFYLLGKNWEKRVETIGKDTSYNPDSGVLII